MRGHSVTQDAAAGPGIRGEEGEMEGILSRLAKGRCRE